jgi:hypothetical protein
MNRNSSSERREKCFQNREGVVEGSTVREWLESFAVFHEQFANSFIISLVNNFINAFSGRRVFGEQMDGEGLEV